MFLARIGWQGQKGVEAAINLGIDTALQRDLKKKGGVKHHAG
jgi:hypothetical protein